MVIWGVPERRGDLTAVEEMPSTRRMGGRSPREVADVTVSPTPNVIEHEDLSRFLEISSNVRGRDLGAVAPDIEEAVPTSHSR